MKVYLVVYFATAIYWLIGTLLWGWHQYKSGHRDGREYSRIKNSYIRAGLKSEKQHKTKV